jgi:NADP-dependent 3-hydroxy acid dehydrogenase YdfG
LDLEGSSDWESEELFGVQLDVCEPASVERFIRVVSEHTDEVAVLLNAAGLALGQDTVAESVDSDWQTMLDTNVMGMMRMTRSMLPLLRHGATGHIVNIGSTASFDCYPGGGGYTASKHAVRAITTTLRLELNGEPIRVTQIDPGITRTRFAEVRYRGDLQRESAVYQGITPLSADDIAACVVFAVSQPPHVNIDQIVVRPLDQAASYLVSRHNKPGD